MYTTTNMKTLNSMVMLWNRYSLHNQKQKKKNNNNNKKYIFLLKSIAE